MKAAEVISTLNSRGVELWQEGSALRYRAPMGMLTEQDKATLKVHKAAILRALASTTAPASPSPAAPSSDTIKPLPTLATANRQAMPVIAAVVDQLRSVFGQVQVIYAEENGRQLGQPPDPGAICQPPHVPVKRRRLKKESRHD